MTDKDKKLDSMKKKDDSVSLTPRDIELLRWVQDGKTNEEIGELLSRTKWTAKYHLKNIMKKMGVSTRAQAVSQAIGMGVLPPLEAFALDINETTMKVGIVGGGKGGTVVLSLFKNNPLLKVEWVADRDLSAEGLLLAMELHIPTAEDYRIFLKKKVDVVINLTGSNAVAEDLRQKLPVDTELMGGVSAKIMWQLFDERRKRVEERERVLKEHEALYHLGLLIESIDSIKDAGYAIVDYATKLTGTPAGSLALYDEEKDNMQLIATKGFSSSLKSLERWEIRKGGLTYEVLNHEGPLYIQDIREMKNPNPILVKEGVKSLLAAPLTVEGRIIGVLYVNDFKKRRFRAEDISLFSLLTIYAGLTLERVRALEETRLLSITDGLTGLRNQRYLMEQMQKEIQRSARHKHSLAVIMFDIDYFKKYNDTYGHLEGNKVLKVISNILKKNSRVTDTVGRFGGEEFCVIMPQISRTGAKAYALRVLKEIEDYPMENRVVTMSGGISSFPKDGKTHLDLLQKADELLYAAKKRGRNCIIGS
jgi:diguanylate cyclase (GGDEF)-like protein